MTDTAAMQALVLGLGALSLVGCGPERSPSSPTVAQPPAAAAAEDPAAAVPPSRPDPGASAVVTEGRDTPICEALPGWRFEAITLPPEFAPDLPPGSEVLWFAPGMFKPDAPDYFTYAFALALSPPQTLSRDNLTRWLTQYYRGLMAAVAKGSEREPAHIAEVELAADLATGTVTLSDEFTNAQTITLSLQLASQGDCLQVLATAAPNDANWAALAKSAACLCGNAP